MKLFRSVLGLTAAFAVAESASAFDVRITVENLAPTQPTGLYFGPLWLGFHNGTFDLFNPGASASSQLELLAETGSSAGVAALFQTQQPLGFSTVLNYAAGPGPGIYIPGSTSSLTVSLDTATQRYLSFGTMVVPSNDTFLANADPLQLMLFDALGNFSGPQSWTFLGTNAWDAGTEVNTPTNGAAFLAGVDASLGTTENGVVHLQGANGLDNVIGLTTAAGTQVQHTLGQDPLLRISVVPVPEPSTYGAFAAGTLLLGMLYRRRRAVSAK